MNTHRAGRISVALAIFLVPFLFGAAIAQDYEPRVSPAASVTQTLGEATTITVDYSRPGAKGRTIWGELIPMEKVWRTGANEATTITVSDAVLIQGKELAAGTYGLFTIPGEDMWTVIFNGNAEQWGAYDYDESKDVLRVTVAPSEAHHAEWLTFSFRNLAGATGEMRIHWGTVAVDVPIAAANPGEKIRASLKAGMSQTIGAGTTIEIGYSRPGVKGRTVWGELVPFGKVWRAGANENTTFSVSKDVLVEGKPLAAGTYGVYAIPEADSWTVIFSRKNDAWGSRDYSADDDALRIRVAPTQMEHAAEWMAFAADAFTLGEGNAPTATTVSLRWAGLEVPFTVAVTE